MLVVKDSFLEQTYKITIIRSKECENEKFKSSDCFEINII